MYNIAQLNHDILIRNQFNYDKHNVLINELIFATGLSKNDAQYCAHSVCKWITFGIEGIYKGLITTDLKTYFKTCIDNGWVRASDGWLFESYGVSEGEFKHTFADKFNIVSQAFATLTEFKAFADTQDDLITTLRIKSFSGGYHSLLCYKINGSQIYISDTSSRGIAQFMDHFINDQNFVYATCMIDK